MVRAARTHLTDAQNESIDSDSQFDLAYGAAHRNLAEYQGRTEIDERLLADLIRCTKRLEAAVTKLEPPKEG